MTGEVCTAVGVIRSPAMRRRWQMRRDEAIAAVRDALASDCFAASEAAPPLRCPKGETSESGADVDPGLEARHERLVRLLHKVAGTAAIFDEAELGIHAAELERALKLASDGAVIEDLAHTFLAHAQGPVDELPFASRGGR